MRVAKYIIRAIEFFLIVFFIFLLAFWWRANPSIITEGYKECVHKYPLYETYKHLTKTHQWKMDESINGIRIKSYKDNIADGILIETDMAVNKENDTSETFFSVTKIINNRYRGYSIWYIDGIMRGMNYYQNGKIFSMNFNNDLLPLDIFINKVGNGKSSNIGMLIFEIDGSLRGVKFNAQEFKYSKERYDNNQTAYQEIKENGINYRVLYDYEGNLLLKWPEDNNICKAQFFDNGRQVEIPFYFDEKEFEKVYHNIKDSATKITIIKGKRYIP